MNHKDSTLKRTLNCVSKSRTRIDYYIKMDLILTPREYMIFEQNNTSPRINDVRNPFIYLFIQW